MHGPHLLRGITPGGRFMAAQELNGHEFGAHLKSPFERRSGGVFHGMVISIDLRLGVHVWGDTIQAAMEYTEGKVAGIVDHICLDMQRRQMAR